MKTIIFSAVCLASFIGLISFGVMERPSKPESKAYNSCIDTIDGINALLLEQETIKQEIHQSQGKIENQIEKVEKIEGRVIRTNYGYIESAVETDSTYEIKYYKND